MNKKDIHAACYNLADMFRLLADNMPDLLWAKDLNGNYLFVNQAMCDKLLNAKDIYEPIGKNDLFFALRERARYPDNPHWHDFGEICQDSDTPVIESGKAQRFDEYGNVQGEFLFLDVYKAPLYDEQGGLIGTVGCARVVTHEKALEKERDLWKKAIDSSHDGIMITDKQNKIIDVNNAFTHITGYSLAEVLGKNPRVLRSQMQTADFYTQMWDDIHSHGGWQGELCNRHKQGHLVPMWLTISTVTDDNGEIENYVSVFSDISEVKKKQEKIEFLAYHDPLTLLPNRQFLQERLNHSLSVALRHQEQLALLFLDLDHFKWVNDSLGHAAGDKLLKIVAKRLCASLRANDTACRLAGDEFVVILEGIKEVSHVERIANKLIAEIASPMEINEHSIKVGTSIGISVFPDDGLSGDVLLKNADIAMYEAKSKGRNRFQFYHNEMNKHALHQIVIEEELEKAINLDELEVYYQPQVNMQLGIITGAEALIRWNHPKYGLQMPEYFIEVAEASDLILKIGELVLESVCRQYKQWQALGCGIGKIAINLSPKQFSDAELIPNIKRLLEQYELSGDFLEFEVTEAILMQKSRSLKENIEGIKALGIHLVLDDFGTGYSSIASLRALPVDVLKIDSSFIHEIGKDIKNEAIIRSMIVLAQSMNMEVIAEGVEAEVQQHFLSSEGCDIAQGHRYAQPMQVEAFEKYCRAQLAG